MKCKSVCASVYYSYKYNRKHINQTDHMTSRLIVKTKKQKIRFKHNSRTINEMSFY